MCSAIFMRGTQHNYAERIIATITVSVCLSVHPSVTSQYHVEANDHRVVG